MLTLAGSRHRFLFVWKVILALLSKLRYSIHYSKWLNGRLVWSLPCHSSLYRFANTDHGEKKTKFIVAKLLHRG
jgi:hypothetical protein